MVERLVGAQPYWFRLRLCTGASESSFKFRCYLVAACMIFILNIVWSSPRHTKVMKSIFFKLGRSWEVVFPFISKINFRLRIHCEPWYSLSRGLQHLVCNVWNYVMQTEKYKSVGIIIIAGMIMPFYGFNRNSLTGRGGEEGEGRSRIHQRIPANLNRFVTR